MVKVEYEVKIELKVDGLVAVYMGTHCNTGMKRVCCPLMSDVELLSNGVRRSPKFVVLVGLQRQNGTSPTKTHMKGTSSGVPKTIPIA